MVSITDLQVIPTIGGKVIKGIRLSEMDPREFGEFYFSAIDFEVVRAWKRHKRMTMNLFVPEGLVRFVFIVEDEYLEFKIGEGARTARLTVPPGIWFGFQGLGMNNNLIANIASIEHDPAEIERVDDAYFDFEWSGR